MSHIVISTPLTEVEEAVERAFALGLTPIIVDTSEDDKACSHYSYQPDTIVLDVRPIVDKHKANPTSTKSLEPFRQQLVHAMKGGKLFLIRLGDTAPPLYSHWCDEALHIDNHSPGSAFFPRDVFFEGGKRLQNREWPQRLFREADMYPHKHLTYCTETFRVCFATQMKLDELVDIFNHEVLPGKEHFQIVHIDYEAEAKEDEREAAGEHATEAKHTLRAWPFMDVSKKK